MAAYNLINTDGTACPGHCAVHRYTPPFPANVSEKKDTLNKILAWNPRLKRMVPVCGRVGEAQRPPPPAFHLRVSPVWRFPSLGPSLITAFLCQ